MTPGRPFTDETRVTVTFTTDRGALAALMDHPATLQVDQPGHYFGNAVRRGVCHLHNATVEEEEGMSTAPEYDPTLALRVLLVLFSVCAGFALGVTLAGGW